MSGPRRGATNQRTHGLRGINQCLINRGKAWKSVAHEPKDGMQLTADRWSSPTSLLCAVPEEEEDVCLCFRQLLLYLLISFVSLWERDALLVLPAQQCKVTSPIKSRPHPIPCTQAARAQSHLYWRDHPGNKQACLVNLRFPLLVCCSALPVVSPLTTLLVIHDSASVCVCGRGRQCVSRVFRFHPGSCFQPFTRRLHFSLALFADQ